MRYSRLPSGAGVAARLLAAASFVAVARQVLDLSVPSWLQSLLLAATLVLLYTALDRWLRHGARAPWLRDRQQPATPRPVPPR